MTESFSDKTHLNSGEGKNERPGSKNPELLRLIVKLKAEHLASEEAHEKKRRGKK